ncbi:MAG TPA: hypothetical protein VM925_29665 [Labilithrix sp.]|nr:hypothetical protein [Labilithrix sp.]
MIAEAPDCVVLSVLPDVGGSILEEVERRQPGAPWLWLGTTFLHTPQFPEAARVATGGEVRSRADGFLGADIDYTPNRNQYRELLLTANQFQSARGEPEITEFPPRAAASFRARRSGSGGSRTVRSWRTSSSTTIAISTT